MYNLRVSNYSEVISNFVIPNRGKLTLPSGLTFGIEIEYLGSKTDKLKANKELIDSILKKENTWKGVTDIDYDTCTSNEEIISPVMSGTSDEIKEIDTILKGLKTKGAVIGQRSGAHIHISHNILGKNRNYWLNFYKLWSTFEDIIFRFSYGEWLNPRISIGKNAYPIAMFLYKNEKKLTTKEDPWNIIELTNKSNALRIPNTNMILSNKADNETIEFRCPNGTIEPVIWKNNILFFTRLLEYATSDSFDYDYFEEIQEEFSQEMFLSKYNVIKMDKASILFTLISHNQEELLSFLKQYYKGGKSSSDSNLCSGKIYVLDKK